MPLNTRTVTVTLRGPCEPAGGARPGAVDDSSVQEGRLLIQSRRAVGLTCRQ